MHELDAPRAPAVEAIALASLSDAGRVRSENQDAVALIENTSRERLILVADGMGGHRGGETASRICVQMVERVFREPHGTAAERLRRGLDLANEEIYSHALANPELRGMGTTVVVALVAPDGSAWLAWVGDSRCYRLRAGALTPLTRDHSLMSEWISIGVITPEAAETHPRRHELTRALGQSPDVPVELVPLELATGDRLLFCSDGLHGCLNDRALRPLLARGTPEETVHALVDAANAAGGSDNVSVVILDVTEAFAPALQAELAPEPAPPPAVEPEPAPEPEPETEQPPAFELAHDSAAELAIAEELELVPPPAALPDLEPVADLTADIAAELTVAAPPAAVTAEPEPAETSAFELNPEFSFADLDDEIASVVAEPAAAEAEAVEDEPEQAQEIVSAPAPSREPEFLRPSEQQIQIPLMTPVRARRGLDVKSILAGVGGTLLIVALGLGLWLYTAEDQPQETPVPARPRPAVVRTPAPAPAPKATAKPAPKAAPAAKPAPTPASNRPPRPIEIPAPVVEARVVEPLAPKPSARPAAPEVPAAPDGAATETLATEPLPSARGFELPPDVTRFVEDWLRALASHDRASLEGLGFADETSAFAGVPGTREGFRLVAADIDEERSVAGRVYLRMVVSYAFRDASGRFRTQDEQRLILRDVGGRLRYEGRWQQ